MEADAREAAAAGPEGNDDERTTAGAGSGAALSERARLAFLSEASRRLGASLHPAETLDAVARLGLPLLGDFCSVDLRAADGTVRRATSAHVQPEKEAAMLAYAARYAPGPLNDRSPAALALRTGELVHLADLSAEALRAAATDEEHLRLIQLVGPRSLVAAPLTGRRGVLGVLTFGITESGRRYDADDAALIGEFAQRAASALENAHLFAEEREAREALARAHAVLEERSSALDRAAAELRAQRDLAMAAEARVERLQALTAALAGTLTAEEAATIIVQLVRPAVGASLAMIVRLTEDGRELELLRASTVTPTVRAAWARYPADSASPMAAAARTRSVLTFANRAAIVARFPERGPVLEQLGAEAFFAAPLVADDRVLGAFGLVWDAPRTFDATTVAFLRAVADQAGQALERARLLEAERVARTRAERLQDLAARLADARTPAAVIQIAVEEGVRAAGAFGGALALLDDDRTTFTLVAGPGITPDVAGSWQRYPNAGTLPVVVAAREGRPCYSRTREEYVGRDPALTAVAERLGVQADASLPLLAAEGAAPAAMLGVVSFVFAEPRAFHGAEDAFLRAVADLCGQALLRARLLAREQAARAALADSNAQLQEHALELELTNQQLQEQAAQLAEQAAELEMTVDDLRRANETLDVERAAAERLRVEAESASRAKSTFLAMMSHELRTPLNAVLGYADLLDMGLAGTLSGGQRDYVARITLSGRHLLAVINDVLDLARDEASQLRVSLAPVVVAPLLAELLDAIAPRAASAHVTLVPPEPPVDGRPVVLLGDATRVRQILLNLLSNAVKFTEAGGQVTVSYATASEAPPTVERPTGARASAAWVWVRVADTGLGIPADKHEAVFEPFVQVDTGHARRHEGTGLGLTISRRLARLLGGDLVLASVPGVGSAFTLWLPAADPGSGGATEATSDEATPQAE